tara:strand:- start:341 stop:778 length:438 start_codon:yes stop_codon:yes gene_type:complete
MKNVFKIDPGEPVVIEETSKAGVYRQRRLSVFERWHKEGKLEQRHATAAWMFNFDFETAQFGDNYAIVDLEKVARVMAADHIAVKALDARKRVAKAIKSVGKVGGFYLWNYVGLEKPVTKSGKDVREILGALRIVLDQLADHYAV